MTLLAAMASPAPTTTQHCSTLLSQQQIRSRIVSVYSRPTLTRQALKRTLTLRRCAKSPEARKNMKRLARKWRKRYKARRALTPYHCGRHGWFAVPCRIVYCESRYDWNARNPSGAMGAYQLLGWLPANASREAQHRMAAKLWNGGRGASHWVCA